MNDVFLYKDIESYILRQIYNGIYLHNDKIPSERELVNKFSVSRVTIRKTLEQLEYNDVINRIPGIGSFINYKNQGWKTKMDIIAIATSTRNEFFNKFINEFLLYSSINNSLVILIQETENYGIEDSIFKVYEKGVRNVVLWNQNENLDKNKIERLRALGTNIVIFDSLSCENFADCVFMDNKIAMHSLVKFSQKKYGNNSIYIGWDDTNIFSHIERKKYYKSININNGSLFLMPWEKRNEINEYLLKNYYLNFDKINHADVIICEDGEIGSSVLNFIIKHQLKTPIVSIDDFKESSEYNVPVYAQDFNKMVQYIFDCLNAQNKLTKNWKPAIYSVEGKLITNRK